MHEIKDRVGDAVAKTVEATLMREVRADPVPRHVGIIMDGNRRFAEALGEPALKGHEYGRDTLENVLDWCLELEVKHLTVYAFSSENFNRNPIEVKRLMELFEENFLKMAADDRVHKNRIHIRAIGQLDRLPKRVREAIRFAEERTRDYDQYFYTIAVAYGGRQEILDAIKGIAEDVKAGRVKPADIDEALVAKHLYTAHLPDPDLILRTSGEERISNFLLWQMAYSELYFTDVYWPGFRRVDFLRAIRTYQLRQRRYGK
ncbi:MAG: tritrans,polycis-undecaprenyl-diphosphate synthase [Thermoplasmata archaeon]|jgi:tritrans,polycis-undecaprenyl-diphosphate synthase [geranylgeranyl-diphosphate specific]|nr:tritrans,polycis-undecaprenyl-diphosphate synthase [Thermoplasmata archaeon]